MTVLKIESKSLKGFIAMTKSPIPTNTLKIPFPKLKISFRKGTTFSSKNFFVFAANSFNFSINVLTAIVILSIFFTINPSNVKAPNLMTVSNISPPGFILFAKLPAAPFKPLKNFLVSILFSRF